MVAKVAGRDFVVIFLGYTFDRNTQLIAGTALRTKGNSFDFDRAIGIYNFVNTARNCIRLIGFKIDFCAVFDQNEEQKKENVSNRVCFSGEAGGLIATRVLLGLATAPVFACLTAFVVPWYPISERGKLCSIGYVGLSV